MVFAKGLCETCAYKAKMIVFPCRGIYLNILYIHRLQVFLLGMEDDLSLQKEDEHFEPIYAAHD